MTIQPVDDQILIRRAPAETRTAAGLHLPERDVALPLRGTVLAVGPGRKATCGCHERVTPSVQPGDEVLHARYAGTDLVLDGQPCLVLREDEILGVLTP
jgi:chaperonin GroES